MTSSGRAWPSVLLWLFTGSAAARVNNRICSVIAFRVSPRLRRARRYDSVNFTFLLFNRANIPIRRRRLSLIPTLPLSGEMLL